MATATATRTAPTEAEIHQAIAVRTKLWPEDNPRNKLQEAIEAYGDFMYSPAFDVLGSPDLPPSEPRDASTGDLWWDLRPSEARDLEDLYRAAVQGALLNCEREITELLTGAALAFAERHPDAPRARVTTKHRDPA
jgi:hypothetical protein